MSAKFVSKNSNYMVVLRPGTEGSRALGTPAISGLYVKFLDGMVEVDEESIVEQMRDHSAFGTEFVEVKDEEVDPYKDTREDAEPGHVISEMKYGHIVDRKGSPIKMKITPQMKKVIEAEAAKLVPELLKNNPELLKETILGLAAEMKEEAPAEPKSPSKTAPKAKKEKEEKSK